MTSGLPGYEQAARMVADYAGELRKRKRLVDRVELWDAAGRILATPVCADSDQPPFARSTRDGFACRAAEALTHEFLAIAGATRAGEAPAGPLAPGAAWEIMTGAPVPSGADAVAMVEHVELAEGRVRLLPQRNLTPGENIVAQGAQAHAGDELLPAGSSITYAQIAVAASCGLSSLAAFRPPRVAILTTGDELVAIETTPAPGQIRNSNAPMLAALVIATGGEPWILPTAADTAPALDSALDSVLDSALDSVLDSALAEASQADLLLISGGVSAGKFDLVEPALARLGARFHFTGVRIQPGKPLVFGDLARGSERLPENERTLPFFGLPGNPVSSAVTFLLFAAPILAALAGALESGPRFALAELSGATDSKSKPGLTRFLPAWCTFSADSGKLPQVALVPWQGSGDLAALARSNCFLVIPEEAGSVVSPNFASPSLSPPNSASSNLVRILLP